MGEPIGKKVLLGGDPLPEGQQVVTCCERCGTGRYADHTTMRCASCGGPLFDTRTGKAVTVAEPPARAGYLVGELAPEVNAHAAPEPGHGARCVLPDGVSLAPEPGPMPLEEAYSRVTAAVKPLGWGALLETAPVEERRRAEELPKVPVPYRWDDAPALGHPEMNPVRVRQIQDLAQRSFVTDTEAPPMQFIPPPIELTREAYEAMRDSPSPLVRRIDLAGLRVTLVSCDAVPPGEVLVFGPPDGVNIFSWVPAEKH